MMKTEMIKERFFIFAYNEALRDATQMRAFKGEKKYLTGCTDARKTVKRYIDSVIDGTYPSFEETANCVMKQFNEYIRNSRKNEKALPVFSFENAQKLINMTVKYIYLSGYIKSDPRRHEAEGGGRFYNNP